MGTAESTNLVKKLFQKYRPKRLSVKKLVKYAFSLILAMAATLLIIDRWVAYQAEDQLYTKQSEVETFDVAVVLGTSKYLGKVLNEYYSHRINAAIALYQSENIGYFLLSGDNAHRSYNEPWTM